MSIQVLPGDTQVERTINELLKGRANNVSSVTLTPNTTTTTTTDTRIKLSMTIMLSPKTANAAAALTNVHISVADGSFTLTHENNAQADRTFDYVIHGS